LLKNRLHIKVKIISEVFGKINYYKMYFKIYNKKLFKIQNIYIKYFIYIYKKLHKILRYIINGFLNLTRYIAINNELCNNE